MIFVITGLPHSGQKEFAKELRKAIIDKYSREDYWDKFKIVSTDKVLNEVLTSITDIRQFTGVNLIPDIWKNDLVDSPEDLEKAIYEGLKTFLGDDVWIKSLVARYKDNFIIDSIKSYELEYIQDNCFVIQLNSRFENRVQRSRISEEELSVLDSRYQAIPADLNLNYESYHMASVIDTLPLPKLI